MKKCPQCGREYDPTMSFCLDDGNELLYGPANPNAELPTLLLSGGIMPYNADAAANYPRNELASERKTQILSSAEPFDIGSEKGFWIAVLPFRYNGENEDLRALADGVSEEIVTGLSRFSYLRVISRVSTLKYTGHSGDVRMIGRDLGARYILEGSLRQSGLKLRLAVQLVDAATGAHLWADNYERRIGSETNFNLQDDLVPSIVSTVADWYGVLPKSMSDTLEGKEPEALSPYEAMLRFFGYNLRITADDHRETRTALEQAVLKAPGNADCWAMLANIYLDEYKFGFNSKPDPLERALMAATRATDAAPSSPLGNCQLAHVRFFRKEFDAFRESAERAIRLNPLDGAITGYMGVLIACSGDWDLGCELTEKAMRLNPHHPGWFWGSFVNRAYLIEKDYQQALRFALKSYFPKFFYSHLNLAAIYGQLGETLLAEKSLRELLDLRPDIGSTVRDEVGMWLSPEFVEQWIDGLCKAGLQVSRKQTDER